MDTNEKKYPYIPSGRQIFYVPADNYFMQEAEKVAREESNVLNHPTGAVIVKEGKIISRASNRNPFSNQTLINLHKKFCLRRILRIKTGKAYFVCPGCAGFSSHAERRAVEKALNQKTDITEADLYLWGHWWCCKSCWDSMISAGIKDVYLLQNADKIFGK